MNAPVVPALTLAALFQSLDEFRFFRAEDDLPPVIPFHHVPGKVPLVVIVGPNASGKSFVRRLVRDLCRRAKVECIAISMEFRTETYNPAKAFVFGDESWKATGEISAGTVLMGIKTCRERSNPHTIFWDEPDLGLSEAYAGGMGQTLAAFAASMPALTIGAFVVTHSKALLRQLAAVEPHYVHLGEMQPPQTLQAWLDYEAPVRPLEQLQEDSYARFRRITAMLKSKPKD